MSTHDIKSANATLMKTVNRRKGIDPISIPSGFPSFDRKGGLRISDLILVGSDTSIGKTTFAFNLAARAAESNFPSMIITFDNTFEQVAAKIAAMFGEITYEDILSENRSSEQLQIINDAVSKTDHLPLYIDDTLFLNDLRDFITCHNVKLVVIDYLQAYGYYHDANESEESFYERVCRELKNLAKELKVCIVLVVQFKRPQDKNSDPRPDKSMIRGGGGIEQAADTILLLYRPNYYGRQLKYRKDIPTMLLRSSLTKAVTSVVLAPSSLTIKTSSSLNIRHSAMNDDAKSIYIVNEK